MSSVLPTQFNDRWSRIAAVACGAYAFVGGSVSLAGWVFDQPRLADWFNKEISIQPNAALAVIAAGGALLLLARDSRRAALACGVVVAFLGGITIFQYLTRINLGIDAFLMFGRTWGRSGVIFPGRMGPPSATSWTLLGIALILASLPKSYRVRRFAPLLGMLTAAIASLSLVGYLYSASVLYTIPTVTVIALQTATFILAVSLGVVASVPERRPMRLLLEDSIAGIVIRRIVPWVILAPVVIGLVRVLGERAGYYDTAFGSAIRSVIEIALLLLLLGWMGSAISRQARKQQAIEASLAAKERQLQHITDNAAVIVAQVSRDLRYQFVNRTCAEFLGRPIEQIIGRPLAEIMGESAVASIQPHIDAVLAGERVEFEAEVPYAAIGSRFMRIVYVPDRDSQGNIGGWIAAITDITQRKRAEDALREADRRKDEFLATLAHELRNPLAPVRNAVELLKLRTALDPDLAWSRDMIDRQVTQMSRLLDDLLDVSRITQGKLELRKELVELQGILQNAVETNAPLLRQCQHELILLVPPSPLHLDADPVRLGQVFGNLLNNACKYTTPGGRIELTVRQEAAAVLVQIRDTGIGIPPDKIHSIFEIFSQIDRSLEKSHAGLGIGLHLVKRIVEMHNGSVTAYSDGLAKGSVFEVRLPWLVKAPPQDLAKQDSARQLVG